jgi:hypothetical protein
MNNTGTKKLIVATGTPSPNMAAERVSLINELGQPISTKTDAELNSQYSSPKRLNAFDPAYGIKAKWTLGLIVRPRSWRSLELPRQPFRMSSISLVTRTVI